MSGEFKVGVDYIWPRWFALAVADNKIRTESGGAHKPIRVAHVTTADGVVAARDGDTVALDEDGALFVAAGKKWRFHV